VSSLLDRTNAQIAELKASMKRNVPAAPTDSGRKKSALEQMIPENSMRGRKRKQGVNGDARDAQALSILCDLHFIANCQSCQSWDKQVDAAEDQGEDDKGWMSHALSFEKDRLGKDLNWKRKNDEELVVIDPREKARDIKEEARAKKMARAGYSTKAWDQDRDKGKTPERKAGEGS